MVKTITIGILIFHHVEELDFIAPFEILSYINKIQPASTKVLLVAEQAGIIRAFNGLQVIAEHSLQTCPDLDILVIPGGQGRLMAMHNDNLRNFILKQSQQARYITSVCTGAFLLAEAGLLDGKTATTYHTALTELQAYDAVTVKKAKVVHDGKIITAAGVSSGLELGLYLVKLIFGADMAQAVADRVEYNIDIAGL